MPQRGADLLSGGDAGYGVYATADGRHMAVAPLEAKFWDVFCEALGRPEWKTRHAARGAAAVALRRELEDLLPVARRPSGGISLLTSTAA